MSSPVRKAQRTRDRERLRDVAFMEWGAPRNFALRDELGLVEGEIGMISRVGWLQVVVDARDRADELARIVGRAFLRSDVTVIRRTDGRHVVQADIARYAG
jgi:hypothetical protein